MCHPIVKYQVPLTNICLGKKLGEGGYGCVYLSQLNATFVAVKKVLTYQAVDMAEIRALRYTHE